MTPNKLFEQNTVICFWFDLFVEDTYDVTANNDGGQAKRNQTKINKQIQIDFKENMHKNDETDYGYER